MAAKYSVPTAFCNNMHQIPRTWINNFKAFEQNTNKCNSRQKTQSIEMKLEEETMEK